MSSLRHMRWVKELVLGIKTLWLHKLRSLLTMLGVIFGVASVIAMLAIGEGASKEALDRITGMGIANVLIDTQRPRNDDGAGNDSWQYGLVDADLAALGVAFINDVRVVAPVKAEWRDAQLGPHTSRVRAVGTTPAWFAVVERDLIAGRRLADTDVHTQRNVVVLTEQVARELLPNQGALGSAVRIGGEAFEIVGIVRSASGGSGLPDHPADVYMPLPVHRARLGGNDRVEHDQIIVQARRPEQVASLASGIERLMSIKHPDDDYALSVPLALLAQAEETKQTFSIVLGSIAGISLLVGGIGIMNIMLASVTERTREIGIRRAIGAKRNHIIRQFLIETLVLSLTGGIGGVLLGLAIPSTVTAVAGMPTVITASSVILALVISAGVGIVFGLYPAVRAARLDPIVALRHE